MIVQSISLSLVLEYDKIKFNTNNCWNNGIAPIDYKQSLENTYTNKWIDKFHNDYFTIIIDDEYELNWMKKACEISMQIGRFSELYNDELELFLEKYNKYYEHIFDDTEYFVRTENVSLKCGQHSVGPYTSFRQIIESLVSCKRHHTPIYYDTKSITLYIMPWLNIYREFRVFVYNKKITAISQQNLYNVVYDDLKQNELYELFSNYVELIKNYFENNIIDNIDLQHYTYDFAILENDKPYFIEPGSFGKEYAAGSSLFDWINDEEILLQNNDNPIIHFRFTVN